MTLAVAALLAGARGVDLAGDRGLPGRLAAPTAVARRHLGACTGLVRPPPPWCWTTC
ncbi:hypothetical protein LT493_08360 [Streptomyces tricolor]|nr:hypothetical protein [Streptomyces tricolor]